jgi:hypothetical protein
MNPLRAAFAGGVLIVAFFSVPVSAQTANAAKKAYTNAHLVAGIRLYTSLQYEAALEEFRAAAADRGKSLDEEVAVDLYEGLTLAGMLQTEAATRSFMKALALSPDARLPIRVGPKIQGVFDQARREMAAAARRAPTQPAPTPPKEEGPQKPPEAMSPTSAPTAPEVGSNRQAALTPTGESATSGGPSPSGFLVGAAAISDVLAGTVGAEIYAGYRIHNLDLSARLRPVGQVGVGVLVAYGIDISRVTLSGGIRGDVYPGAAFGGGLVVGARLGIAAGFGIAGMASLEGFSTDTTLHRPLSVVLTGGVDWRQ